MRGFEELEAGQFFLCTETSPRCYVIQQVNESNLDDTIRDMRTSSATTTTIAGDAAKSPTLATDEDFYASVVPMLPWWFNTDVRRQLLSVPAPATHFIEAGGVGGGGGYEPSSTPDRPPSSISCGGGGGGDYQQQQLSSEEYLKARLKRQLEYYFSRENLINDRYLRSQMDTDQYVPIKIIASFNKVAQLTSDTDLIISVLKSSTQVQVDEKGEKVRAMIKRCTIILREIPENANEEEVKSMFEGCPSYQSLTYGLNDSWYVTFATEDDTRRAFVHLQNLGKTFNGKPVYARIKTGGAPIGADVNSEHKYSPELRGHITIHHDTLTRPSSSEANRAAGVGGSGDRQSPLTNNSLSNLGQILAQYGYLPRATFRPSMPIATNIPPLITMSHSATAFTPLQPSPTSFSQPIISSRPVNGYNSYNMDNNNCSGGEQSGSSRFETSSNSTVGTMPKVGKHRITDVPRINRNDRRSPIYFHNNYANNKKSSHKGGQQQPLIFDGGKYFMPNNEEITNNIVDQDNNKYIINNNNNSSFYSGRPTKYGRQKSIDSATSLMHTGKSLRFLTKPMDRSGGGFKERRGGGGNNSNLKSLNNWRSDGGSQSSNRLGPNYYGDSRRVGTSTDCSGGGGGYSSYRGGNSGGSGFHSFASRDIRQTGGGGGKYHQQQLKPLTETSPSPVSWRQGGKVGSASTSQTSASVTISSGIGASGPNDLSLGSCEDSLISSTTSGISCKPPAGQTPPQQQQRPQPLVSINAQKPAPLSSASSNEPKATTTNSGGSSARPVSLLLNGHKSGGAAGGGTSSSSVATGHGGPRRSVGHMSTAMFNSSRRTKKATANDGGAVEQHRSDERVSEVQQSASRSGFSFVEVEFPTLDHRKGSLKNTTTAVENDDGGPMAREKATTLEAKTSSHGSSNNRVQFSVVVAGRRRASSSELEGGPTPPVSSSNKQILKAADTKSYAQSLLAPQKTQILRRESAVTAADSDL